MKKFKISSSGFMCVKYHNNKKKVSFYRFLLGNASSIKDILLPQNKQKNHIIKIEIHSVYKKDHIIMLLLYIIFHFFTSNCLSSFLFALKFCMLGKSKRKIMRNNLIFGEFIVVCLFYFGFFLFGFGYSTHTHTHFHIKYIPQQSCKILWFISIHVTPKIITMCFVLLITFCTIVKHKKVTVKNQFYLCSVRNVIKSSGKTVRVLINSVYV